MLQFNTHQYNCFLMKLIQHYFIAILVGLTLAIAYTSLSNKPSRLIDKITDLTHPLKSTLTSTTSFSSSVKKASPSVVTIYTQHQQKPSQSSLGSGVIMTENGLIITNFHVINNADNILVHLKDGRSASAIIIATDKETDLAVLKIPFRNLQKITLSDPSTLKVGDIVLTIGNPLNIGQTVTMGIVSATGRNRVGINTYENFIQTDASINPGNSGGALINVNGDLVGINTAIFSQSGGSNGIGFAIPVDLAVNVMQELITKGKVSRGWFGVIGVESDPNNTNTLNKGVLITEVFEGSPAAQAGIQKNDVITQINFQYIHNIRDVVDQVATFKPGSSVKVLVMRNQEPKEFNLTITERPTE